MLKKFIGSRTLLLIGAIILMVATTITSFVIWGVTINNPSEETGDINVSTGTIPVNTMLDINISRDCERYLVPQGFEGENLTDVITISGTILWDIYGVNSGAYIPANQRIGNLSVDFNDEIFERLFESPEVELSIEGEETELTTLTLGVTVDIMITLSALSFDEDMYEAYNALNEGLLTLLFNVDTTQ